MNEIVFVSTNIWFAKVTPKDLVLCGEHSGMFFVICKILVGEETEKIKNYKNFLYTLWLMFLTPESCGISNYQQS